MPEAAIANKYQMLYYLNMIEVYFLLMSNLMQKVLNGGRTSMWFFRLRLCACCDLASLQSLRDFYLILCTQLLVSRKAGGSQEKYFMG